MLKQAIAILLVSVLIIVGMPYAQQALHFIVTSQEWVSETLKQVFSGGEAGNLIRELLGLLAIPVAIGLIPVIVYWLARRKWFPYFMQIVWIIWMAQTAALIVLFKTAG